MAQETWYPKAKRLPITTGEFWKSRSEPITAIVEHITAGSDSRNHLQNVSNGSSTHFLIRDEGNVAVVYQFMPIEWAAWGNGIANLSVYSPQWVVDRVHQGRNINLCTISVEHESPYPMPHPYSEAMIEATIELDKWLVSVVSTIKRDREHIIGHYQIDGVNRPFCPGGPGGKLFPFDRVVAALQAPPAPAPQTFDQYAQDHPYLGLALDPGPVLRTLEDGNVWQTRLYERGLLHQAGPGQLVMEARIGWMWLQATNSQGGHV